MDNCAVLENALSDGGESFIPTLITEYLGDDLPELQARIKIKPADFVVEERFDSDILCTATASSDLAVPYSDTGEGDLVAVTLVKSKLTTEHAIEKMRELLGVESDDVKVTYAGMKDRWAVTAQRVVIGGPGITFERVMRACMPDMKSLRSPYGGIFIKDPIRVKSHLSTGQLLGNRFSIKVYVDGLPAEKLEHYVRARIGYLSEGTCSDSCDQLLIPNAFGRQRLGRRQNLFGVGHDFIVHGAEAGIKRFLSEPGATECFMVKQARQEIGRIWQEAESQAKQKSASIISQREHLQRILEILERRSGRENLEFFQRFNMVWEAKVVRKLLQSPDLETALRQHYKIFSMWVGAYQGFWFNQILGRILNQSLVIPGDIDIKERKIPLYMREQKTLRFYSNYCPEALPSDLDPLVSRVFLSTRKKIRDAATGGYRTYFNRAPRRPLFVQVNDLNARFQDGLVKLDFELRSGSYATTLLEILFDLDQPD